MFNITNILGKIFIPTFIFDLSGKITAGEDPQIICPDCSYYVKLEECRIGCDGCLTQGGIGHRGLRPAVGAGHPCEPLNRGGGRRGCSD